LFRWKRRAIVNRSAHNFKCMNPYRSAAPMRFYDPGWHPPLGSIRAPPIAGDKDAMDEAPGIAKDDQFCAIEAI
jgi:hypothetical protein